MKKNKRKLHGYQTTNRAKHNLKIHLILVCKYRKKLLYGELDVFLTDGCFVCSVGEASPETIQRYIQNQG